MQIGCTLTTRGGYNAMVVHIETGAKKPILAVVRQPGMEPVAIWYYEDGDADRFPGQSEDLDLVI